MSKKLLLLLASLACVAGVGAAFATNPTIDEVAKTPHIASVATVTEPEPQTTVEPITPTSESPVSTETASTVAPQEVATSPVVPKTTDELKIEATQKILSDGNNEAQPMCFDLIMQEYSGWVTTEDEMLQHIANIEQNFISFCFAHKTLQPYFQQKQTLLSF